MTTVRHFSTCSNLQQPAIISKMKIWKHHQIERQKATHKFISFIFSQSLSRMNPRYTERGKSDNAATLSLNLLHTHPSYMHRTMCILLRLHKCNFYPNLYYQSCASPEFHRRFRSYVGDYLGANIKSSHFYFCIKNNIPNWHLTLQYDSTFPIL